MHPSLDSLSNPLLVTVIGLLVYVAFERRLSYLMLYWQVHLIYAGICVFILVAVCSMAMEDNSSHFASIPNSEYVRVVGGIFNTDPSEIHEQMHAQASKQVSDRR